MFTKHPIRSGITIIPPGNFFIVAQNLHSIFYHPFLTASLLIRNCFFFLSAAAAQHIILLIFKAIPVPTLFMFPAFCIFPKKHLVFNDIFSFFIFYNIFFLVFLPSFFCCNCCAFFHIVATFFVFQTKKKL